MLRLKPREVRTAQDVGADQALYLGSKLKPKQEESLTKIL